MKFSYLSNYFAKISKSSLRNEITVMLADLFKDASSKEVSIISYLSLGSLDASYKGLQFNYSSKNCLKLVADILNIGIDDLNLHVKKYEDLGEFIENCDWPYSDEDLTLEYVYDSLLNIESSSGTGSQEDKTVILKKLLSKMSAISASYIVKILIGTMRLGFSEMTIIDAYSWMINGNKKLKNVIEDAYNVCADIGYIGYRLKEYGIGDVEKLVPFLGVPIRPAAAERLPSAQDIFDKIGQCIAQPKLDGFRLQIHIDKIHDKIWFFSRNLLDMSKMFPDLVNALEKIKVENCILEGEAIVFDEETQAFVPFQETVKRKRKHNIDEFSQSLPLHLFIFDILYLNNENLMSYSHKERRERAIDLFSNFHNSKVAIIEEHVCATAKQLEDYFYLCLSQGNEGIVAKRPDSKYQPGKRNFNWIKLKRSNAGHIEDTVDAVVLGYYSGKGRRNALGIGAFLIGVYNHKLDCFETIAKVGTGLKDNDWIDLKKRLDENALSHKPKNVICSKDLTPDVWVYPKILVLIKADEITKSPVHSAGSTSATLGYALRFPRFLGYRNDKGPQESTDIEEIVRMYSDQYKKSA